MTQRFTLLILLSFLVLGACKKKEVAPQDWKFSISVSKTIFNEQGITSHGGSEEGIEVFLYNGRASFINNQPLATATTVLDDFGAGIADFNIPFKDITNRDSVYFRAKKGNLNSIRYNSTGKLKLSGLADPTKSEGVRTGTIIISSTPTKLRFQVFDAGQKVERASIDLYTTESAYLYKGSNVVNVLNIGDGLTDVNGEVEFSRLEPRQYWFRITKGTKNNSATTFKTSTALPDDANITNVIQVGIQ